MDKLISAEKLSQALRDDPNIPGREFAIVKRYIEEAEDELKHGRWVERCHKNILGDFFRLHCSECGEDKPNSTHTNHCPNCGAKMDGERRTE